MLQQNVVLRFALAAAAVAALRTPLKAQDGMPVFGAISITAGETLRVNVVNTADPAVPPDPCGVQINYINADGVTIKTANFTVNNGQIGWGNINYSEATHSRATVNIDSPLRQVLRPVINYLAPPCRVATAEVYETVSGRSTQYVPPMFLPAVQTNANPPLAQ